MASIFKIFENKNIVLEVTATTKQKNNATKKQGKLTIYIYLNGILLPNQENLYIK